MPPNILTNLKQNNKESVTTIQQMSTIQLFVIILPLRKKKKEQQFEVMEYMKEEHNLGMSLDFLDRI